MSKRKRKQSAKRDHLAEYKRRITLGGQRGISKGQARGHAGKGEVPVATLKQQGLFKPSNSLIERKYYKVLKRVAAGASLSEAAKKLHIAPKTVRKLDKERDALVRDEKTGRYVVKASSEFDVLTRDGTLFKGVALDKYNATILGKYWNAVQKALNGSNTNTLKGYRNVPVYDIYGQRYVLLTNINDVRAVFEQMTAGEAEDFNEKFYRPLRHAA